jgi:hypothetical protein
MDLSKYFICDNPLYEYGGGVVSHHIYREGKPRFFAALLLIDGISECKINSSGLNLPFRYIRGDGLQQVCVLTMLDIIDRSTTTKLSQLLQDAAHFYVSCMNVKDQKVYGATSTWKFLTPYNDSMPEVAILEVTSANSFVLFYPAGISTFKNHEELDAYLSKKLNYSDQLMENMSINVLQPKV